MPASRHRYVAMTYEKILALSTQLDMMLVPKEGRILALHPYHATDLQLQDLEMFKTFFSTGSMFGFKIHVTSMVPKYNGTTGKKVEWDAPVRDTDAIASTVWYRDAVCRAKSMEDMYYRLNDPEYRGDVLGFNMRGIALPITGKYLGAMFTTKKS